MKQKVKTLVPCEEQNDGSLALVILEDGSVVTWVQAINDDEISFE